MEAGPGIPGQEVLAETPDDLGLLLWQCLRDVQLWAGATAATRPTLFSRAAAERRAALGRAVDLPAPLAAPVGCLTDLLTRAAEAEPALVGEACAAVARWAEERGALGTAVQAAVAGAEADPASNAAALLAGTVGRGAGRIALAEAWMLRALALARRARDREPYGRASLELGRLWSEAGKPDLARRALTRGARAGRSAGASDLRGLACRELCRLSSAAGDAREALHFARAAVRALRPGHRLAVPVRCEAAALLLARRRADAAQRLLEAAVEMPASPEDRVAAFALLTRAAAAAGDAPGAARAWDQGMGLVLGAPESPASGRLLLDLARAALEGPGSACAAHAAWSAARAARRLGQEELEAEAMSIVRRERGPTRIREAS